MAATIRIGSLAVVILMNSTARTAAIILTPVQAATFSSMAELVTISYVAAPMTMLLLVALELIRFTEMMATTISSAMPGMPQAASLGSASLGATASIISTAMRPPAIRLLNI